MRSQSPSQTALARRGTWSLTALAACLLSAACGSHTVFERAGVRAKPSSTRTESSAPGTVPARRLGPQRDTVARGTPVPSMDLFSERVFVNKRQGFSLAVDRGDSYPVTTNDGGREWKVSGPVFMTAAADAPAAVSLVGAAQPHTYFAFGGGGSVVDFSTDGGRHWWDAYLGDDVLSVVPGSKAHHLIAVVQDFLGSGTSSVETVVYVSTDGGRHWRPTKKFAY